MSCATVCSEAAIWLRSTFNEVAITVFPTTTPLVRASAFPVSGNVCDVYVCGVYSHHTGLAVKHIVVWHMLNESET